jgi:hypothetical protein
VTIVTTKVCLTLLVIVSNKLFGPSDLTFFGSLGAIMLGSGPLFGLPDDEAVASFRAFCYATAETRLDVADGEPMIIPVDVARSLLVESAAYGVAESLRPSWSMELSPIEGKQRGCMTAGDCFPGLDGSQFFICLNSSIKPELKVRSSGVTCGFNGEFKSAGDGRMFDGAIDYCLWDMAWSSFAKPAADGRSCVPKPFFFYKEAPVAYAICGVPPTSFLMKIEMAGRAFISAMSEPFFLGSYKHKAAIAQLPGHAAVPEVDLSDITSLSIWKRRGEGEPVDFAQAKARQHTIFTVFPSLDGCFYKIKEWPAYNPRQLIRCIRAYEAYAAARLIDDTLPPSLLAADLFYGFGQIVIRMPFQRNYRPATTEEMNSAEVANALVEAFLWLAVHDLAYIDFRSPNVLVPCTGNGSAILTDYDDMLVTRGLGDVIKAWMGERMTGNTSGKSLKFVLQTFFDSLVGTGVWRIPYCFRKDLNTFESVGFLAALEDYDITLSGKKRGRYE